MTALQCCRFHFPDFYAMGNLRRVAATLIATFTLSSCSVPPVMIPGNATCEDLLFLYYQQREEWKQAAGSVVYASSAREQLNRIEAAITAKGCLMPADPASGNASPSVPTSLLDEAVSALHAAAPEEFTRLAVSLEALETVAPIQSEAYNAAGLALFIAAPVEFVIHNAAWKTLYDAAPQEFRAISTEQKALWATIAPEQYAESTALGKALQNAALEEFTAYNSAWHALRNSAPSEFSASANAQKRLYAAAPVEIVGVDEASFELYATAADEFTVFEYAALHAGTIEALREAAPLEFSAYMSARSGTPANDRAFEALAAAAPNEFVALMTAFNVIETFE